MNERELFFAALDLDDPAARAAFLTEACGGDTGLLQRVNELLQTHERAGNFLERPAVEDTRLDTGPGDAPPDGPGSRLGPYRLVRPLGEGGMGTVYLAEQEQPIRRQVALKVIKRGMDSKQVLARFAAERQALALMDHPHIAKVLDAGTTATNQPFFVMELVKGIPVNEHCDRHKLGIPERLTLFMQVCRAVQHAHQKGIIHRDLKPSNILVGSHDGKPAPHVIDFGLAKAMSGQPLTEHTLLTGLGQVAGTPLYMAPEQAASNAIDVDTRADIYALGVVLYELLTGTTPIEREDLSEKALDEILRVIRDSEPPMPSRRVGSSGSRPGVAAARGTEPAKLGRLLKGELDWIVMKALDKDRDRRYETANAFAEDVGRFLNHEPVLAWPPSASYRLRKFLRRHRPQAIAAGLVLLTLVGGVVGTTWGLIRAEQRRGEAEAARTREAQQRAAAEAAEERTLASYRASTDDAVEQLIGSRPGLGPQEKKYLKRTLERWEEFASRKGDDERSQAIRAEGHFRVALLWERLGQPDDARREYEMARGLRKLLADAFPDVPRYQQELANTHNDLGLVVARIGQGDEARKEYESACDLLKKLADAFPDVPQYQQQLASSHLNLGILLEGMGQGDEARKEYETARDLQVKLVADFPDVPQYWLELGGTHNSLGILLEGMGQGDEARKEYETARDLQVKLVADFPDVPDYLQRLAYTHTNLGAVSLRLKNSDEARKEFEIARDLHRKLAEAFPAIPQYQVDLGGSYGNFGVLVHDEGKPADSLHWFDLAIHTLTPVYEKESRDVKARRSLRNNHWSRALAYDDLKKHAEALKDWDRAIELSAKAEQPPLRVNRATSRLQAGQVAEAVAEVAEMANNPAADAPGLPAWTASQWYDFACVYAVASGKTADKKQEYAERAVALLQKAVQNGYKDAAHLAEDRDLDALRPREDFKKLLADLHAWRDAGK